MKLNSPTKTVIYTIEQSIKTYRKFSHSNITKIIPDMTVDQALILIIIDQKELCQTEIADAIFKDYASMTRIVDLMIKKKYITKTKDSIDKRKSKLSLTKKGISIIKLLTPIVAENRKKALSGITKEEEIELERLLKKITSNCS